MVGLLLGCITAIWDQAIPEAIIGSLIMGVPLYLLAFGFLLIRGKQGLGGGDIKMALVYGMYLRHLEFIYAAFFIAFILAGAFLLTTKLKKRKTDNSGIPLIPFMSIGTTIIYIVKGVA